ncbi:hypothetical protein COU57_02185 [Candidatus Pacearchaeota archaeon CG10_big_fil_rev_8_21_14_0_10_32_14]|nr:MAG: hypothetical protein COU57_02185 [Candidatus Pacearchaeota archaeon CG10_big_fil_rev_8_21_14_0_10_32_14]
MKNIDKKLKRQRRLADSLGAKLTATLQTLNELNRTTHDPMEIKRNAMRVLSESGYTATIDNKHGLPLSKEGENYGFLVPLTPSQQELTPKENIFFEEYARTVSEALDHAFTHQNLQRRVNENERIKNMLVHELKSPISSAHALTYLSEKMIDSSDFENAKEMISRIRQGLSNMSDLTGLLYLSGLSKENLKRDIESVDLKKILRVNAIFYDELLKDNKIGLELMYKEDEANSLVLPFNKSVFSAVTGTLFGNAVAFSPEESIIYQGIKNNSEHLEYIVENLHANKKERTNFGLGSGLGFPFVQSIVSSLDGILETYDLPLRKDDYSGVESFGYEHASDLEGYKTFGVRVRIPLN